MRPRKRRSPTSGNPAEPEKEEKRERMKTKLAIAAAFFSRRPIVSQCKLGVDTRRHKRHASSRMRIELGDL
jgi:hypothetical protein